MISIDQLVQSVVYLVIVGLICGVLWWALRQINPPEPFAKVARVVLILLAALLVIGVLMSLVGRPLIRFGP